MKQLLLLIFLSLNLSVFSNLSLDNKVSLLYETTPGKNPDYAISEIKKYCNYLKKYDNLSPKKRVSKIFSDTKKKYLFNYSLNSFFSNIFSISSYNCVTGTALFAIIFDELEIPYSIIEVPQHVYLIAFPHTLKIAVESTDIKNGIYAWSDYSKQKSIQYLLDIKKITPSEWHLKGTDAIIEKYFYTDNELDFNNLVGMHFLNRALYYFERDQYSDALYFISKANIYYENERNQIIEGSTLRNLISETEYSNIEIVNYLLKYYQISTKSKQKELTIKTFRTATYDAYIERKDLDFIDSTETLINTILRDSLDRNTFYGNLYLSKCIYYGLRRENSKAKKTALDGYKLIPETKLYEDIIAEIFIEELIDTDFNDFQELIDTMTHQMNNYPFLITIPSYFNYYVSAYHDYIGELFTNNKPNVGFEKLESLMSFVAESDIELNEWYVPSLAFLYGNIASYYYRNKDYPNALEWVDKGIEINPESESLINKKKYINDKLSD